jgi:hypothetical protein
MTRLRTFVGNLARGSEALMQITWIYVRTGGWLPKFFALLIVIHLLGQNWWRAANLFNVLMIIAIANSLNAERHRLRRENRQLRAELGRADLQPRHILDTFREPRRRTH